MLPLPKTPEAVLDGCRIFSPSPLSSDRRELARCWLALWTTLVVKGRGFVPPAAAFHIVDGGRVGIQRGRSG